MTICVMGIDPGKSGGLAVIEIIGGSIRARGIPMPLAGKLIDGQEIASFVAAAKPQMVVVEAVHSMPKQGVSSSFTFGMGFGIIQGVLLGSRTPYRLVTPQAWKKAILSGTQKDKDAAVAWVRRAYPMVDLTPGRTRKPHDGIADAVCLAEQGRQWLAMGEAA